MEIPQELPIHTLQKAFSNTSWGRQCNRPLKNYQHLSTSMTYLIRVWKTTMTWRPWRTTAGKHKTLFAYNITWLQPFTLKLHHVITRIRGTVSFVNGTGHNHAEWYTSWSTKAIHGIHAAYMPLLATDFPCHDPHASTRTCLRLLVNTLLRAEMKLAQNIWLIISKAFSAASQSAYRRWHRCLILKETLFFKCWNYRTWKIALRCDILL